MEEPHYDEPSDSWLRTSNVLWRTTEGVAAGNEKPQPLDLNQGTLDWISLSFLLDLRLLPPEIPSATNELISIQTPLTLASPDLPHRGQGAT
ncbi:hypothetical protein Cob_v000363 [Colletotrichum orbiculare MAFF 240422]|uniref:Uncharacterized protein n=1 Tax=Colletotrichum orbiculare (strain 104-T / ATCC 96160 / CBS 514.97 / LARS 414 / MAFF 240422) TaxID=1213857 RepID=A0A484G6D9_COLOR|nr:hypothetical protein Cob_v000363 [Colletotrichum orbiculare MAFF 240422]